MRYAPHSRLSRDRWAIGVAIILPSVITWIYFFGAESGPASVQVIVYNVVKTVQFGLPIAWVAMVQRKRIRWRPCGVRGVPLGMAFGCLIAAAMMAFYGGILRDNLALASAADQIATKLQGWNIDTVAEYAALGVFYSVVHSLLEEYYWRWFVFAQLRCHTGFAAAAALSSIAFMAHHVLVLGKFFGVAHWATWLLAACVAIGGFFWAWLYQRSGSLLGPWMSHLLIDAAIFAIGYDLTRSWLA